MNHAASHTDSGQVAEPLAETDARWADALTADAAEAFAEAPGGFYDHDLAQRLLDEVLSVGNTIDPAEAYRRFRGRDHSLAPLLRARGFASAE